MTQGDVRVAAIPVSYLRFLAVSFICSLLNFGLVGCAADHRPSMWTYVQLNYPFSMRISEDEHDPLKLQWAYGVDAGGSGHRCGDSEPFICMDAPWKFAVPRTGIDPDRVHRWSYRGTAFAVDAVVPLNWNGRNREGFLISATKEGEEHVITRFIYSNDVGLMYVLDYFPGALELDGEPVDELGAIASVYIAHGTPFGAR